MTHLTPHMNAEFITIHSKLMYTHKGVTPTPYEGGKAIPHPM